MPKYLVEIEVQKTWTVEMEMEAESEDEAWDEAEDEYNAREDEFESEKFMADEEVSILSVNDVRVIK